MGYPPGTPAASQYRFLTTNILTGEVLSDTLPMIGETCNRQINAVGEFTGSLQISGDAPQSIVNSFVSAVVPWKSVLWVLQNSYPIWNGVITSWDPSSILQGQLAIQAATMEEMFKHRIITDNLTYSNVDVFEIFRNELLYALGKTPNGQIAGSGKYADTSGIVDTVQYSGVYGDIVELMSLKTIYDAWTDLVNSYGLEYTFEPAMMGDPNDFGEVSLYNLVRMGLPVLGRPYSQTGLQIVFPAWGAIDYAWQAVSTAPANRLVVSGQGAGATPVTYLSQFPAHGQSTAELNQGFPLLEDSYAVTSTVTSQAQLNGFADLILPGLTVTNGLTPTFTVGENARPQIRDAGLGDEVMVAATSPLHPAQYPGATPGVIAKFRISGWTLTFPGDEGNEGQIVWQLGNGTAASLSGSLSSDIYTGGTGGIPE